MNRYISILFFVGLFFLVTSCGDEESKIVAKADRIHNSMLTVDTHCDTPMRLIRSGYDLGVRNDNGCVDFPRMKEGGLDAEFFAVFIGQGPRNHESYNEAHEAALTIFDAIHRNVEKNSDQAELAYSVDDAYRISKSGKSVAFIGMENGYPIGNDLTRIKQYYDLGARYITLSHSRNNDICDSSTDPNGPEFNGLSGFGVEVVKEMNRLGIMVDVSHISDEAFYDVLEVTKAPVIASHSSCRAICESPRNLDDDMILALKKNGGVIQICILSNYLRQPEPNPELDQKLQEIREKYDNFTELSDEEMKKARKEYYAVWNRYCKHATVSDAIDHIDHVIQLAGIDYVGIGTDFDGGGRIENVMDVSQMKNLTIEMLRRGYTRADLEKIWGGNIMRVLAETERFSRESI